MQTVVTPDTLAEQWEHAHNEEKAAREKRIAIEEMIIAALHFDKIEGRETYKLATHNVEMRASLNIKPDWDAIEKLPIDPEWLPIKIKKEIDKKKLDMLMQSEPKIYAQIAAHLETKPAKVGVTVKRKD